MFTCSACDKQIVDGENMTIVTDAHVFNDGEVEHMNTWHYHSEHVSILGRAGR